MDILQTEQSAIVFPQIHRSVCNETELFDDGSQRNSVKCTAVGEKGILDKSVSGRAGKNQFQSIAYPLTARVRADMESFNVESHCIGWFNDKLFLSNNNMT